MPPEGIVFITLAIIVAGGALLLPLARALGERLRGRPEGVPQEDLQALRDDVMHELQQVRQEVAELGERVDFTERLLAKRSSANERT